ncbi:MAG: hypothetical protein ACTHYS_09330 [Ancrocorticia populi]|uniref:hypothetical protein n=1 Tax=Ancrocorticia populi TaxID=2175228 RepID=UPI003F9338D7
MAGAAALIFGLSGCTDSQADSSESDSQQAAETTDSSTTGDTTSTEQVDIDTAEKAWFETEDGAVGVIEFDAEPEGEAAEVIKNVQEVQELSGYTEQLDPSAPVMRITVDNRDGDEDFVTEGVTAYDNDEEAFYDLLLHSAGYYSEGAREHLDLDNPEHADADEALTESLEQLPEPNTAQGTVPAGEQGTYWLIADQPDLSEAYTGVEVLSAVWDSDGTGQMGTVQAQPMTKAPDEVLDLVE